MTSRFAYNAQIIDKLPGELEHRVHEFLRILEVCALQGVSKNWRVRTREALHHKYRWDVTHVEGVDSEAHVWLEHVGKACAGVKIRSLRMVRGLSKQMSVGNVEY